MTGPRAESAGPRPTHPPSQPSKNSRRSGAGTSTHDTAPSAAGSGNSPDMSDDESVDLSAQDHGSPSESVKSSGPGPVKSESEAPSGDQSATGDTQSMPLQKRRRVTRACDECRRKKIKCDGKQPCTHCSVYSYECTYDKPSNRRRNPAPQYIEALEARLQRAETLLRKFMPDVDLSDPTLDPAVQQEFQKREQSRAQAKRPEREPGAVPESQDAHITSMIESIGQLDINEGGEWDFHGISSGAVFLRRMKEHFQGLLGSDYRTPFLFRPFRPAGMFSLDSPKLGAGGAFDVSSVPNVYELPPLEKVRSLSYYALNCATCLMRVVHQPTYYETLEKFYKTPQSSWGHEEHRFLGLLYSIMALGSMYNTSDDPGKPTVTHASAIEQGIKYYASARLLLQDVAECRDITSLQALVYMILFLQATSNISGCYAFLGIAFRSSLRMGLHRHLPHAKMTPIEDESRRRLFHVIRQLDTYVSAILGFPILLSDQDMDQPLPSEVDDEYITKDAMIPPPPGTPSFFQAFAAHSRLMTILRNVVTHIYPLKGVEEYVMKGDRPNATYMISYARIKEIERELHDWYEALPIHWRPSPDGPIEVIRVRTLLRFAYAHVQLMLYRPFLHYVSPRLTAGKKIDDRYYNCAAAGISVSRNIVHIGIEIQKQAVLIGPYWFILYTEFFAILSLVFYVLENPNKPGTAEILADAHAGRDMIASLAERSITAERISSALKPLFEQLQDRLKKGPARPAATKKRSAPGPGSKSGNMPLPTRPGLQDGASQRRSEEFSRSAAGQLRREATVPHASPYELQTRLASQSFGGNLQELLPLDVGLSGASPDSPSGAAHGHGFHAGSVHDAVNPLYKLDAVMFSSGDPFAYPSQPLMDASAFHPGGRSGSHAGTPQGQDQFYMQNVYDDIEGQLLGPIPPYLVPQGQGHHAMDPASQMYNAPNMLTMQQDHGQRQRQQAQHRRHQQQMAQRQQQQQQQHQRHEMMEDVMVDPAFQGDWDDILGNNPGFR
ncbi:putative transcriptional regulatory protein [Echria macrotheca]|uniref:Transcriptional regulatory protein n=1 Tax=Echria macrotheca TaxID=438768 RepID=A0AAJ0B330_9PEZI|nr:putative transcriptional regulatory protein [Echria macrotheca]